MRYMEIRKAMAPLQRSPARPPPSDGAGIGRISIAMELCTLALLAALGGFATASIALQAFAALLLYLAIGAASRASAVAHAINPASILTRNLLMFGAAIFFLGGGVQRSVAAEQDVGLGMPIAVAITGAVAALWAYWPRHSTAMWRMPEDDGQRELLLLGTSLFASAVLMFSIGKAHVDGLLAGLIALRIICHCIGERLCRAATG